MKKWTIPLFKIFGIRVKIHITFFFIVVLFAITGVEGIGVKRGLPGALFILVVFLFVLLHEISHCLVAIKYGGKVKSIILFPFGGVAQMERIPTAPVSELKMAIAGPFTNFVIAGILYLFFHPFVGIEKKNFISCLVLINLTLGTFNLLPAFPMDGGRILRALLGIRKGYYFSTKVAIKTGKILAIGLIVSGLFINPWLLFIGIFVFMGATTEEQFFKINFILKDFVADEICVKDFKIIPSTLSLSELAEIVKGSSSEVFVVMEGEKPIGLIKKRNLPYIIEKNPPEITVAEICEKSFISIDAGSKLEKFLSDILSGKVSWIAVYEEEKMKGVIYPENLLITIKTLELLKSLKI